MIKLKSDNEIKVMREACRISALALHEAGKEVKPGVSTKYLDDVATKYIKSCGAKPSFSEDGGFPTACCISVNEEIIHTVPSVEKILKEGDIVTIDVGAKHNGFHGDNAFTFKCGEVSKDIQKLLDVTKESLDLAIKFLKPGITVGDLGNYIQNYVESFGFSVVRNYSGHGIGKNLHEDPKIPNYGNKGEGEVFKSGMVVAIEPMVNLGSNEYEKLKDGWTIVTKDGKPSAHFEHTVAIFDDSVEILTLI